MTAADPFLPDRRQRRLLLGLMLVGLLVYAWFDVRVKAGASPERHETDFTCYTAAAVAMLDQSRSPYEVTNLAGWPYLYPPLFALLVSPVRTWPFEAQQLAWFVVNVALAWGVYREAVRIANGLVSRGELPATGPPRWLALTGLLTVIGPALSVMRLGQVSLLLLYCTLLGLRLSLVPRSAVTVAIGGVVWALAASVKVLPLFPAVALGALLGRLEADAKQGGTHLPPRTRALMFLGGLSSGLAIWLLLVPSLFIGWTQNLRYLDEFRDRILQRQAVTQIVDSLWYNKSLVYMARRGTHWSIDLAEDPGRTGLQWWTASEWRPRPLPDSPAQLVAARVTTAGLGVWLGLLLWRVWAERTALAAAMGMGLIWLGALLASPVSWSHYFVMALPATTYLPLWAWNRGARRQAIWLAIAAAAVGWLGNNPFNAWVPARWTGVWFAAWLLAASRELWRLPAPSQADGRGHA